jgi:Ribosomal protein L11 methyltransferase (PrmA)
VSDGRHVVLPAEATDGRHVLDVGTGTGALAIAAARAGAASVTAVDLSRRSAVATWLNSRLDGVPVSNAHCRIGTSGSRSWRRHAPVPAQQSKTDQQMSFRNRWSSSTSSRIASGSRSRCHRHSSRPAASDSPAAAAARAALIA